VIHEACKKSAGARDRHDPDSASVLEPRAAGALEPCRTGVIQPRAAGVIELYGTDVIQHRATCIEPGEMVGGRDEAQ
jgi:hypothetical protein